MDDRTNRTRLRLRLVFADDFMLGPGKADLLTLIDEVGSIAQAGRKMGMSYKRAWLLVESMNAAFAEPVVDSTRGGSKGGGAHLTDCGRRVLKLYRELEKATAESGRDQISGLESMLKPRPGG